MTSQAQDTDTVQHFSYDEPNDYYVQVIEALMQHGVETAPRGLKTKELHPTTAIIYNPRNRVVTTHGRVLNLPFALAEVLQILCGQNDAQALKHYNSQIIKIQGDLYTTQEVPGTSWEDHVTRFNAAYGERMRHFDVDVTSPTSLRGLDQLRHVIETLANDRDSRQASIVLSHPYWDNVDQTTKDRACNVYAHVMIRDGALDWTQIVRSNDAVWGVPYNMMQWTSVQEYVANSLAVPMGKYFLVQDSLHIYEPFYEECLEMEPFNVYEYLDYTPIEMKVGHHILKSLADHEMALRLGRVKPTSADWKEIERTLGVYWCSVLETFASYRAFKEGDNAGAYKLAPQYTELRFPLLRCYLYWRWLKDPLKYSQQIEDSFTDLMAAGIPREEAVKWTEPSRS